MSNTKVIVKLTLFCSLLFVSSVYAQESWWQKAKELFNRENKVADVMLNDEQIAKGLKQALSVGSESVINTLQQSGAFADNPNLRIKLPSTLARVGSALDKIGMGQWTNELEDKLNEAAEQAIPAAGPILATAINNLTLEDIQAIYQGENDAATQYFKAQMSEPIAQAMDPIIKQNLESVGALKLYENIMSKYNALPFMPDVSSNLVALVKSQTISSVFEYLAKEEAAIRANPEKRTTELLKKMFAKP
ncbi:Protein of unknown function [Colwellia chukchiensis]|uniref:DUF4197 domain-containing protein n=1 Tax=Colwellia chukchiensis TaxID=641665 RepID=A0A1H7JAU9_9GAMM|nr:DUF4197 domain-containing protein [Colwellia chukchiensis]SEK71474.1 Protein of unknown function [Colwellia chukchiensis]